MLFVIVVVFYLMIHLNSCPQVLAVDVNHSFQPGQNVMPCVVVVPSLFVAHDLHHTDYVAVGSGYPTQGRVVNEEYSSERSFLRCLD